VHTEDTPRDTLIVTPSKSLLVTKR